ncbi:MAG: flagellar biosynthesis anti-sigma factor FlgM [Proteobacteria bacterium]|nr:flagellar biosynthesis anti-sigma factor FlgM [Pseudomonadota bacterium]
MPPIEIGPSRPVGAVQARTIGTEAVQASAVKTAAPASAAPQVQTSDAVKAGDAPVDAERVATIRKAIEEGSYPVIPTKIADAMIAAGMLLRNPQ